MTLCEIKYTALSLHITVMFKRKVLTYLMMIYKALVKFYNYVWNVLPVFILNYLLFYKAKKYV